MSRGTSARQNRSRVGVRANRFKDLRTHQPIFRKDTFANLSGTKMSRTRTMSSISPLSLLLLLFVLYSSSVSASIPQVFHHANLLRTIDLTKPYIRDSTAVVVENISNTTQTEYLWGIPLSLAPKTSYLEVKEKKTGVSPNFAVERAVEEHAYRHS